MNELREAVKAVLDAHDTDVGESEAYYRHLNRQMEILRRAYVESDGKVMVNLAFADSKGCVVVNRQDLETVEHRLLNAERVFKRDLTNHKFMGFDLINTSIDMVSAMLAPKE